MDRLSVWTHKATSQRLVVASQAGGRFAAKPPMLQLQSFCVLVEPCQYWKVPGAEAPPGEKEANLPWEPLLCTRF